MQARYRYVRTLRLFFGQRRHPSRSSENRNWNFCPTFSASIIQCRSFIPTCAFNIKLVPYYSVFRFPALFGAFLFADIPRTTEAEVRPSSERICQEVYLCFLLLREFLGFYEGEDIGNPFRHIIICIRFCEFFKRCSYFLFSVCRQQRPAEF